MRVGGRDQPPHQFVGDSPWRPLTVEFTVGPGEEDVELRCELRARAGEARFDRESLQLVQLP